jgi:hypothetical protein
LRITVDVHVGVEAWVEAIDCVEVGSNHLLAFEIAGRDPARYLSR